MFEAGAGKAEIQIDGRGMGMMGYGMYFNVVRDQKTKISSRAVAVKASHSPKCLTFVCAEICFPTVSLKRGVLKKLDRFYPELGIREDNLMITAQHTHSAPGGYSHYGFYNLSIPGFVPKVYQAIVNALVDSIVLAHKHMQPAVIRDASGDFDPEIEIAFNRSLKSYNANPDVTPLEAKDHHLALDRTMDLLRIESPDGSPIASLNWFGVHTTSMSNDNTSIHFDNKGYASQFHEHQMDAEGADKNFISIFGQALAGDVTPNYIWDKKKKWTRGKFEDDDESAKWHGKQQFEKAREIWDEAGQAPSLEPVVASNLMYADMSNCTVDPDFAHGKTGMRTSPACIGVTMLEGTVEGPGMTKPVAVIATVLIFFIRIAEHIASLFMSRQKAEKLLLKYKWQGPKTIIIETGEKKILGTRNVKALVIPGFADPVIKTFKEHHRKGGLSDNPWTPQILPIQLFRIGDIVLAGVPAEITTVAGRRLKKTIEDELAPSGIRKVILITYANAYSGYITTNEEYQHQRYEAGHTVFGEWSLGAYQTKFRELARKMAAGIEEVSKEGEPAFFSDEEISKRTYEKGFKIRAHEREMKRKGMAATNN
ncbi:MAG: neutral/alkaline non-lysosomal ceramidase N-terminal domain-containing protein [Bacteroidia bacterium]|nr:neutral/alkaline non-lysosomal ceramidase N-terminal domain-containing protein [Bacteroidia bacterium]